MISRSFSSVNILSSSLLALLLAACGGSGTGGTGGTGGQGGDAVAAYQEMIHVACERQVECGYAILNQGKTVEECQSLQAAAAGEVKPTLGDGAVVLSKERLLDCKAALAAGSCAEVVFHAFDIDPSCNTFWEGTLEEGEACRGGVASDCKLGLACVFDGQKCPGTCVVPDPPCIEGSCAEGSYCDEQARCVPRPLVGQACGPTVKDALHESSCAAGAHCLDAVCVARVAAGAACTGMYEFECVEEHTCQCATPDCSTGAVCAPAPGAGEACNTSSGCAQGRFCNFDSGTCDDRLREGEACPPSFGACAEGLTCAAGKCQKPGSVPATLPPLLESGADCTEGGICLLGETCLCALPGCNGGKKQCKPGPALGESCQEALQTDYRPLACREGVCDIFETITCVLPAAAGEPCTGIFTLACGSGVCDGGVCASLEQTRCDP